MIRHKRKISDDAMRPSIKVNVVKIKRSSRAGFFFNAAAAADVAEHQIHKTNIELFPFEDFN